LTLAETLTTNGVSQSDTALLSELRRHGFPAQVHSQFAYPSAAGNAAPRRIMDRCDGLSKLRLKIPG
jgi:hypothetical protein